MSTPIIIVLCGRFYPVKALDRMIRVASMLKKDGLYFEVRFIGMGELQEQLEGMVKDYQLTDCVQFLGFLNPPYEEMAKADIFVSTSLTEGYPVNICEALCLGIPIVATRCSGNVEILGENNEYGMIAEQNDESIYQCIKRMIMDEALRLHYRKNALEAAEQFDIEKTMAAVYSVLS